MTNPFRASAAAVLALMLCAAGAFAYSVYVRSPWFGTSPVCPETWLTSDTVLFTRNWYREGPWNLRFALVHEPLSIETPTLESREIYTSYPPGGMFAIYAVSRILRHEPTLNMLMACNLGAQYLITVLLCLMLYLHLRRIDYPYVDAFILSLVPVPIMLFLPSPAYHFQMSYFHDLAGLPPFVLIVFLELLRDGYASPSTRKWMGAAQGMVAFYGVLTDWLVPLVLVCVYLKRFMRGQLADWPEVSVRSGARQFLGRSLVFWLPGVLALALFALQLQHFDKFGALAAKFQERTGMKAGTFLSLELSNRFWTGHMIRGYGRLGRSLVIASMAGMAALPVLMGLRRLLRCRRNAALGETAALIFMLLAPCVLQVYFLKQHSAHIFHFFSSVKFCVVLATVPFVLLPVAALAAVNQNMDSVSPFRVISTLMGRPRKYPRLGALLPPVLLLLAVLYVRGEYPRLFEQFLPENPRNPVAMGRFVAGHTRFEDIVFASGQDFETETQIATLAYNMKRVYPGRSVESICEKTQDVQGEFVINYLTDRAVLPELPKDILNLLAHASHCDEWGDVLLYKIPRAAFLKLCTPSSGAQSN